MTKILDKILGNSFEVPSKNIFFDINLKKMEKINVENMDYEESSADTGFNVKIY